MDFAWGLPDWMWLAALLVSLFYIIMGLVWLSWSWLRNDIGEDGYSFRDKWGLPQTANWICTQTACFPCNYCGALWSGGLPACPVARLPAL